MYGGTKTEMARLVKDAAALTGIQEELGIVVNENDASFGNIVNAISVIQKSMGIMGTTSKEAASTIQGSISSMKSSWKNLVVGIADETADADALINNFVESVGVVTKNIVPKVGIALNGAANLLQKLIPIFVGEIPNLIEENLPVLAEAAIEILQSLVDGIEDNQSILLNTALDVIIFLATSLIKMLPKIVKVGLDIIITLANGIAKSIPKLMPTVLDVILQIVETITEPSTLSNLIEAALAIIYALSDFLISDETINPLLDAVITIMENFTQLMINNLPLLFDAATKIIMALVSYMLEPENLQKIIEATIQIVVTMAGAMIGARLELAKAIIKLTGEMVEKFSETDWEQLGKNIVEGMKNGLQNSWKNFKKWFTDLFGDIVGVAKKTLGIASPSKVFKKLGSFTAEGFGIGFADEFSGIKDDIENSFGFEDIPISTMGGGLASSYGGTTISGVEINIYADQAGDSAESIADAVAVALQELIDRRSAVYG